MRAVCESFHLAKDAGFKVVSHMMPDLPNVGIERDVEQFIVSKHTTDHSVISAVKKGLSILKTYTDDKKNHKANARSVTNPLF